MSYHKIDIFCLFLNAFVAVLMLQSKGNGLKAI